LHRHIAALLLKVLNFLPFLISSWSLCSLPSHFNYRTSRPTSSLSRLESTSNMMREPQSTFSKGVTNTTNDATDRIPVQGLRHRIPKLILTKPGWEVSIDLAIPTTPTDESSANTSQGPAAAGPRPECDAFTKVEEEDCVLSSRSERDPCARQSTTEQHHVGAENPKSNPFLRRATTLWKPEESIHAPSLGDSCQTETV
jgi:hypothetical protein